MLMHKRNGRGQWARGPLKPMSGHAGAAGPEAEWENKWTEEGDRGLSQWFWNWRGPGGHNCPEGSWVAYCSNGSLEAGNRKSPDFCIFCNWCLLSNQFSVIDGPATILFNCLAFFLYFQLILLKIYYIPCNPAFLLLDILPRRTNTSIRTETCSQLPVDPCQERHHPNTHQQEKINKLSSPLRLPLLSPCPCSSLPPPHLTLFTLCNSFVGTKWTVPQSFLLDLWEASLCCKFVAGAGGTVGLIWFICVCQ